MDTSAAQGLRLLCSECITQLEKQERRDQLTSRFNEIVRRGHVSDDVRFCSWSRSSAKVEAVNPEAWMQGRAWFRNGPKNLFLFGGVGTGKTHLGRCCLYEAFVNGRGIAEVSCTRLAKTGTLFSEGDGMFNFWKKVEYLLVDDVGADDWTTGRLRSFWQVMDARTARRYHTIMTSNLDSAALLQALRPGGTRAGCPDSSLAIATMDRMKPNWKLEFTGPSFRGVL